MWLLKTDGSYELIHFHNPPRGRLKWGTDRSEGGYAILSHTWGEDEVTFENIQDLKVAQQKAGFNKIKLTCQQALHDGLEYAWVDTCCIDKKSSAELSEAINSMFEWYRLSKICYVFLEDMYLEDIPDMANGASIPDVLEADLSRCRWFTRGWTLQELIAPLEVRFFGSIGGSWREFGSRSGLAEVLSNITGIEAFVLIHKGVTLPTVLSSLSIAKKMSWAANRKTTRVEDIAYSLLGLFGVNMPLLYGEGDRAFRRLQEAIMQITTDHSILLWSEKLHGSMSRDRPLAQHPREFRLCNQVVPLISSRGRPPQIGVAGIHITLPVFVDYIGRTYAILDCRLGNNFRGKIGVQIVLAKESKVSVEPAKPIEASMVQLSAPGYWPKSRIFTRDEIEAATMQALLFSSSAHLRSSESGLDTNVWVKQGAPFLKQYEFAGARPDKCWDNENFVLHWDYLGLHDYKRGDIVWKDRVRGEWICLRYGVNPCERGCRCSVSLKHYRGAYELQNLLDHASNGFIEHRSSSIPGSPLGGSPDVVEVCFTLDPDRHIKITVRDEFVLDRSMCVVNLEYLERLPARGCRIVRVDCIRKVAGGEDAVNEADDERDDDETNGRNGRRRNGRRGKRRRNPQ